MNIKNIYWTIDNMKIIESTENCQTLLYELTDIKSLVAKLKVDKYKDCQWLATCPWFSPDTPVSSINKTDLHDITKIFLKVALKQTYTH